MHDLDRTQYENYDETYPTGEYGFEAGLPGGTFDRPFNEAELNELAMELLSVQNEEELEEFLGSLLKKAGSALGKIVKGPAGKALKDILRNAFTAAVPVLGGALTALGPVGVAGTVAGSLIKDSLEMEGVPDQNRNVEAAKKVIEVGGTAAQQVAAMPPDAPPNAAVDAVQSAMQQQGIAAPPPSDAAPIAAELATSGTWYRNGRTIVVVGL